MNENRPATTALTQRRYFERKNVKKFKQLYCRNIVYLIYKPFKIDDKCFLFHLKSSFRSQDI